MRLFNDFSFKISRLFLVFILSIAGLTAKADPYTCIGLAGCNYRSVTKPIYLCNGESIELYARASGFVIPPNRTCANPSYQWRRWVESNGFLVPQNIGGQTNNKITISTEGLYDCYVSCDGDNYTTSGARVYISTGGVSILSTGHPVADEVCLGGLASYSVSGSGDDIFYKWQEMESLGSWTTIVDATSSTYSFFPDSADDKKQYRCVVANGCASLNSNPAALTVHMPNNVLLDPVNTNVCENTPAGFHVEATGSELVFKWQEKETVSGSWTNLSSSGIYTIDQVGNLTIENPTAAMDGFRYRAIISGKCDPKNDTSLSAELMIKSPPSVSMQPANDTVCEGGIAHFEISAIGTDPVVFKWQKGGVTVKDWGPDSYFDLEDVSLSDNQDVKVLISDQCFSTSNSVSSDLAKLVVNPRPTVSLGGDDVKNICTGTTTILKPEKAYTSYVWSTGDSVQSIEVSDQGSYTLTVTDAKGCSAEDNIFIITDDPVPDLDIGHDSSLCSGDEITFNAGSGYGWYKWSDGSTGQSLKVSSTSTIWVSAGNNSSVCVATDTVNVLVSEPYDQSKLCLVTINESTGRYLIIWERTPDEGIEQYNLYREGNWIGSIAYDGLSIFLDTIADPETRPYRYEMTITDTCGNESAVTPYHIPIFLQYTGYIEGVNLSWSKYQIEGAAVDFNSYSVYKGSDSLQLSPLAENIPTEVSVYIDKDLAALENKYFYRIAGVLSEPCRPSGGITKAGTGPYYHSLSNMDENKLKTTGTSAPRAMRDLSIYPNPAREIVRVSFDNPSSNEYTLQMHDISGKVVRSFSRIISEEIEFSVSDLPPGYYYLRLIGINSYFGTIVKL